MPLEVERLTLKLEIEGLPPQCEKTYRFKLPAEIILCSTGSAASSHPDREPMHLDGVAGDPGPTLAHGIKRSIEPSDGPGEGKHMKRSMSPCEAAAASGKQRSDDTPILPPEAEAASLDTPPTKQLAARPTAEDMKIATGGPRLESEQGQEKRKIGSAPTEGPTGSGRGYMRAAGVQGAAPMRSRHPVLHLQDPVPASQPNEVYVPDSLDEAASQDIYAALSMHGQMGAGAETPPDTLPPPDTLLDLSPIR